MRIFWKRPLFSGVLLLAAISVLRGVAAVVLPLYPDEAYQWLCGHHPARGYYDGPSTTAWIVSLLVALKQDHLAQLRLISVVAQAITSVLIFRAATDVFGRRGAGLGAALIYLFTPLHAVRAVLLDYDGLFSLFWAGSLWAYHRAVTKDTLSGWLVAGVMLGLGILTKWFMVLFPLCLLLFLDLSYTHAAKLRQIGVWFSFLVAAACVAPVLVSREAQQGLIYAGLADRFFGQAAHVGQSDFLKVLLEQPVLIGPLLVGVHLTVLVLSLRAAFRGGDERYLYCACFSAPIFLLFLVVSLRSHVSGEWLECGFIANSLSIAGLVSAEETGTAVRRRGRWVVGSALAVNLPLVLFACWPQVSFGLPIRLPALWRYQKDISGWEDLLRKIDERKAGLSEEVAVASPDYQVCSVIAYMTSARIVPFCLSERGAGKQFAVWQDLDRLRGKTLLIITTDDQNATNRRYGEWIKQYAEKITPLPPVEVWQGGRLIKLYKLDLARGFRAADRLP